MRRLMWLAVAGVFLFVASVGARVYYRKLYIWLPSYLGQSVQKTEEKAKGPVHVFFFYADHFEPGQRTDLMQRWEQEYPKLASRHRDSLGRVVQHTWFYPGEQPNENHMRVLERLATGGYGEVELHYHHSNDTLESARRKFSEAIAYFQKYGFLKTATGKTQFAFVHGNWGLDNSDGPAACGVNRELELLRDLGCFADFTFPALWRNAQPSMVNNIYMATDDDRPKSYDRGTPLRVGRPVEGTLMIFQGPLLAAPVRNATKQFFEIENSDVHPAVPLSPQRVDRWVRANIHVEGKPEWVFIKVHGHAATSDEEAQESLGPSFDRALTYLETRYNDGVNYILHYVTAREAYNLARAAAAGERGDPSQYLDWVAAPYVTGPRSGRSTDGSAARISSNEVVTPVGSSHVPTATSETSAP